jgi:hypothetical protein
MEDDDSPPDPNPEVLLAEADGEMVAGLWQGILDDKGIGCAVKNTNSIAYLRSHAVPLFEVHVLYRDLARARQLLGLPEDGN